MKNRDTPPELTVVEAQFAAAAQSAGELPPPTKAEIAFAGRSNVGKSSLINCLVGRRNLVRTSSTPGCTRKIGFYDARFGDRAELGFVDLPGYGYARRSKTERDAWADLIEGFLLGRATLKAVVAIVDVRRGLEPDDLDLLELCRAKPRVSRGKVETIVVATKLDKLPLAKQKLELDKVRTRAKLAVVGFSSEDGTGKLELLKKIRRAAGLELTA